MDIKNSVAFQRALAVLVAFQGKGLKFKIQLPEGAEYGDLEVVRDGGKKRVNSKQRKRGTLSRLIDPKLVPLIVGDMVQLPLPKLPDLNANQFRGAVANRCSAIWGKSNFATSIMDDGSGNGYGDGYGGGYGSGYGNGYGDGYGSGYGDGYGDGDGYGYGTITKNTRRRRP